MNYKWLEHVHDLPEYMFGKVIANYCTTNFIFWQTLHSFDEVKGVENGLLKLIESLQKSKKIKIGKITSKPNRNRDLPPNWNTGLLEYWETTRTIFYFL